MSSTQRTASWGVKSFYFGVSMFQRLNLGTHFDFKDRQSVGLINTWSHKFGYLLLWRLAFISKIARATQYPSKRKKNTRQINSQTRTLETNKFLQITIPFPHSHLRVYKKLYQTLFARAGKHKTDLPLLLNNNVRWSGIRYIRLLSRANLHADERGA